MRYPDGTIELSPDRAKHWYWRLGWYFWRWLQLKPHLVTVDENGNDWFRRRWLLGGPGFSLYWHHYPNGLSTPEPFGAHRHPRGVLSIVVKGGYWEFVWNPDRPEDDGEDEVTADWLEAMKALLRFDRFFVWYYFTKAVRWLPQKHYHRILEMKPGTRSFFLMAGKLHEWEFMDGAKKGSSRILQEQA